MGKGGESDEKKVGEEWGESESWICSWCVGEVAIRNSAKPSLRNSFLYPHPSVFSHFTELLI